VRSSSPHNPIGLRGLLRGTASPFLCALPAHFLPRGNCGLQTSRDWVGWAPVSTAEVTSSLGQGGWKIKELKLPRSDWIKQRNLVVVKALCYRLNDSRPFEVNAFFHFTWPFQPHQVPGFTQPLTEMSIRSKKIKFLGSKMRAMHRVDNLGAICEPTV
jgi:hypothetical protein